ncbi:MAG TPA: adenosylmethionine--8-amino-7-oxononanoate transaminase [Bacteroidia bacterium]|nr:adenosylmethionine--8-amino-7-oxononanoate transaminase [Bacteroidia bacterium]
MKTVSVSQRDTRYVWHPFTPQLDMEPPVTLVRGEGALLFDEQGNSYIDAISSWWVNIHGHCNAYITKKISEQLNRLEHAIFSGFTHEPAVRLAERLLEKVPHMHRVFFSDDGSTSVEVALKMTFQFFHNKGEKKTKVVALENGYHGDTFGGMSAGARNVFNRAFENFLFDVVHIPVPVKGMEKASLEKLEAIVSGGEVAAFIFEPLVQGAGGMVMYDAPALDALLAVCRKHNVLTIADEVMTGFFRTGKFLATEYCTQQPDIVCLSKGITGGYFPLGATLCTGEIYNAFLSADKTKTFFHGHSYTANPTICAAANASLDLLEQEEPLGNIRRMVSFMQEQQQVFASHEKVREARCTGTILALEIKTGEATEYLNPLAEKVHVYFPPRGVILRPLGNVVYILPPYCTTREQLEKIANEIKLFLDTL